MKQRSENYIYKIICYRKSQPLYTGKMSGGIQYTTGEEGEIALEKMTVLGPSRSYAQLWMCLVVKVKPDVVKNNIA